MATRSTRTLKKLSIWLVFVSLAMLWFAGVWMFKSPRAQQNRVLGALARHDWEELQYLETSLTGRWEFEPSRHLVRASLELNRREFVAAHKDLRLAAADRTARPYAWLLAGECLYAQNRFREAELNFKYAIELDKNLAEAHRWLAISYYDIGLMNEAVLHLNRVAELDPHDPRPHRVIAVIHLDAGSFAIAIEDFRESFRREPNQSDREDMLLELASCQLSVKRHNDALRTLAQCAESAEVLAMRAEAHYALGDKEAALGLADRALTLEADQRLALAVLGKLALDERRFDDAVEALMRAVRAAPSDYDLHYTLVAALRGAGRKEDAEKQLAAAESLRERREEYDDLVSRAAGEPYNADIRYQLAILANQLSLPDLAGIWLKASLLLDPGHALATAELRKHRSVLPSAATMLRGS